MQQGIKLKEIYEAHGGVFGESLYESALEHVNILNDGLFKMLFGTWKNKDLTIDFLNCFLHEELGHVIYDVEFIDKEPIAENTNEKNIRYDVCLILDTGEKVDLEVQAVNRRDMENRSVYYWVKLCKRV